MKGEKVVILSIIKTREREREERGVVFCQQ
jgi:hypothetical protein